MRAASLALVIAVLLAGCAGAVPGDDDGTVHVYVSDEPGAIDEFEHVNVTITAFSLRAAERPGEHDDDGRHRHRHRGNRTVYDINATTVDLTQLQGPNASLLHAVDVPPGEYTGVSVYVSSVNATPKNNTSKTVRVPRDRLTVREEFTVEGGDPVNFVFDVVVEERRDGRTYALRANPAESGTDVAVQPRCDCCNCCGTHNESGGSHGHHHGNKSHHDGGHHHGGNHSHDGCHG